MYKKYLEKLEYNIIVDKLVENARTFKGKELARNLTPYTDRDIVKEKLDETNEALRLINSYGSLPISEIDDLSATLKRIESSMGLSAKALLEVADVLRTAKDLNTYYYNAIKEMEIEFPRLEEYFHELYVNDDIESKINSGIISEDEISDTASTKLRDIRRSKKQIELEIRNKLSDIIHSNTYGKYIQDRVVTVRNGRFVVPVMNEYRSQIKGFIHDMSQSGATVYIEPMAVFDMNNKLNELEIDEEREIEHILENLSSLLFPIYGNLRQDIELISKLDFINSKAKLSLELDCSEPQIGDYINLIGARHPIIDKTKVVPINIYIGEFEEQTIKSDFKTLVITGPNTGGKTVTLKTVGLLTLMAQSGLNISCKEGSTIKVFDNVFADIGDEQSIEESLSTFSSHMKNIAHILDNFTDESLILVDELGSGTDPVEGASLAISLLEEFHNAGAFTLATTHYHEIKEYCISHDGFMNCSLEFDLKTLKPTYHLLMGIPGKSNAFEISEKLGISDYIINRAKDLIDKPSVDVETLLKEIYDDRIEIEKEKDEIQKNLNQVTLLRKSLEQENNEKLLHEQEKIDKARKEAKEILLDAKDEADSIIKKLNKMSAPDIKKAEAVRNELNEKIDKSGANKLDFSSLQKLNDKYDTTFDKSSKKGTVKINNNKAMTTSGEINIIGETVADGVHAVDKYLDNCKMAGLKKVRIVHGKGTGKLRKGIHDYLKTSKYVKEFHLGGYGEGDYGVTIVSLK